MVRQARTYVSITSKHGPSQQLIDFLNYDGQLPDEIGLESFGRFSLQTQHEILLSKLPYGLEGILSNIFKKAETAEARVEKQEQRLAEAVEKIRPYAENRCQMKPGSEKAQTDSITLFDYFMEGYRYNLDLIKHQAENMPETIDVEAWKKYSAERTAVVDKLWDEYESNIQGSVQPGKAIHAVKDDENEVELARSGWSASSIHNASKKLLMWIASEQKFLGILDSKYEKIKNAAKSTSNESASLKVIDDTLGYKLSNTNTLSYGIIEEATDVLLENIKYFEITG